MHPAPRQHLGLGTLNLTVAFTFEQSEALNCLRDKQREECTGVSDTDQFISIGAADIARESILAIFSAGASQAAAGGNSAAKVANAAFYVKDAVDASQSGLELLQSESLVEALLKAGLLSIEVVGLKGSTGQVLEDGKTLCKKFDGQIRVQLKGIKSVCSA